MKPFLETGAGRAVVGVAAFVVLAAGALYLGVGSSPVPEPPAEDASGPSAPEPAPSEPRAAPTLGKRPSGLSRCSTDSDCMVIRGSCCNGTAISVSEYDKTNPRHRHARITCAMLCKKRPKAVCVADTCRVAYEPAGASAPPPGGGECSNDLDCWLIRGPCCNGRAIPARDYDRDNPRHKDATVVCKMLCKSRPRAACKERKCVVEYRPVPGRTKRPPPKAKTSP